MRQQTPLRGDGADQTAIVGNRDPRKDLRRAGRGEVGVYEAFQTLARSREEHSRTAANRLEHETWMINLIIKASEPIRRRLPPIAYRLAGVWHWVGDLESHVEFRRGSMPYCE